VTNRRFPPLVLALAGCAALTATAAGSAGARVGADARVGATTFYALVAREQYVNNRDDRQRGAGSNPFGTSQGAGFATTRGHGNGPMPGDEGLYELTLFAGPSLTKTAGTAVLVCEYGFDKIGTCDTTLQLDGGSLVGLSMFDAFERKQFSVTLTGGTGSYRNARGTVTVRSANVGKAINGKITVTHNVSVLLLEPSRVEVQWAPASNAAPRPERLYSVATGEQFVNNADDEARGWVTNPFGMRDPTQETLESQGRAGPFPGDEALFQFAVYSDPSLKVKAGTADFTCLYAFARNAFCNARYELRHGTISAAGTFSFDAKVFTLAVTGGTGAFAKASGDLTSSPGPKGAQSLALALS
jgi:hypothetical protein